MHLMNWFAEYNNGIIITEKETEFYDIDKSKLHYFGLEGMNTYFKHDVTTGEFLVDKNKICFLLDDCLIGKSTDVINFKEKITVFNGNSSGGIVGFYTGWKEHLSKHPYIELLFWVDLREQKLKLRFRITSNEDSVKLNMIINGIFNERVLTIEEKGKKQEFVFEI